MQQPEMPPDTSSGTPRRRIKPSTILKIGVTLVGLILVLTRLDPKLIVTVIRNANLAWLGVGALLIIGGLLVRSYRWQLILHGVGSRVRYGRLVELYLVGSFFNAFLPSGFGGDVVRAAEVAQDVETSVAVSTVVVDRLTGLMALFAMALLVLPWRPEGFPIQTLLVIVSICVTGLIAGTILIDGRLVLWMAERLPEQFRSLANGEIFRTAEVIRRCGWPALIGALLVSVVFNLMQIGWWAATGKALGLDVPLSYYFLVVPILSLAMLVPSIGGLGVRETLAPFLFAGAGIAGEQAVALSLVVFGLERLASLIGAPVYIYTSLRDNRRQTDEKVAHQHQP